MFFANPHQALTSRVINISCNTETETTHTSPRAAGPSEDTENTRELVILAPVSSKGFNHWEANKLTMADRSFPRF